MRNGPESQAAKTPDALEFPKPPNEVLSVFSQEAMLSCG
jgi:hypothetical protein